MERIWTDLFSVSDNEPVSWWCFAWSSEVQCRAFPANKESNPWQTIENLQDACCTIDCFDSEAVTQRYTLIWNITFDMLHFCLPPSKKTIFDLICVLCNLNASSSSFHTFLGFFIPTILTFIKEIKFKYNTATAEFLCLDKLHCNQRVFLS